MLSVDSPVPVCSGDQFSSFGYRCHGFVGIDMKHFSFLDGWVLSGLICIDLELI